MAAIFCPCPISVIIKIVWSQKHFVIAKNCLWSEKIFCDPVKNACFTHSDKDIYFSDQHHLAEVGASMLVDEIEKGIEKFIKY